jgi:hypothetical protein
MSKLSNKEFRLYSLAFGMFFAGVSAYAWMPHQEPIWLFHYTRAIGLTVMSIIFFVASIRGQKALNKKRIKNKFQL